MSNAQGIAFLSFGLIIPASGTFPSPYDVRLGVDTGDGDLGTLTVPAVGDVRSGVEYGGDGDQYTGTLYVRADSGETWTDDALELWHDQVAEYGTTMQYEAWTFDCIKNPINLAFRMTQHGYDEQADTTLDILRTDAQTSGLYSIVQTSPMTKRPIVTVNEKRFQVLSLETDDNEQPSIRLSAKALK